jgi:hypothetical protein
MEKIKMSSLIRIQPARPGVRPTGVFLPSVNADADAGLTILDVVSA